LMVCRRVATAGERRGAEQRCYHQPARPHGRRSKSGGRPRNDAIFPEIANLSEPTRSLMRYVTSANQAPGEAPCILLATTLPLRRKETDVRAK
jgi:hypothetical protein